MTDPQSPIESPPPRTVEPWTRVAGHLVVGHSESRNAFCKCGEGDKEGLPVGEWRARHLSAAWPILVERLRDEPLVDWRSRLLDALDAARQTAEPEVARLMDDMDVRPGWSYPVVSDYDMTAQERVEVLEHQLAGRPFDRMSDLQ